MTVLPAQAFSVVLAMLVPAQVDPGKGVKGAQPVQPWQVQPQPQHTNPSRPGPPLWILTQLPIWVAVIIGARRQQQARAAHLKMLAEEEESKTPYTEEDLMEESEFKIVRNELNLFEQQELLEEALRDEGRAGWQLVEKFDGNRLRLRRAASQRANDGRLPAGYDPYRTVVLAEATQRVHAAMRIKVMKTAGWVLAGSIGAAGVFGIASTALRSDLDFLKFLTGFTAVCAGVVALISLVVLIVRWCSTGDKIHTQHH